MSFIVTPEVLLPRKSIDMEKWAVIACDQFTSQREYWDTLKSLVDNVPSTYHLILPEAYLEESDMASLVERVNDTMRLYLANQIFETHRGFVLVERKTPYVKRRLGLVIAIDLDEYEYEPKKPGRIKATEKTVPERIPARVGIRENAPIELPHVLVLVDDVIDPVINDLYKNRKNYELIYDFNLNMNGGHVKGYMVEETDDVIHRLENLSSDISLMVGDGNHSLAAAKVCWENLKETLPPSEWDDHPARYALVELISLHDEGLTFEPIHRVLFDADEAFVKTLAQALEGSKSLTVFTQNQTWTLAAPDNPFETIKIIQDTIDHYLEHHPSSQLDFIHGLESLKSVVKKSAGAIGITMPPLKRDLLLPYIRDHGVLPRKSFSLGEAEEKRYYIEGKKIQR